AGDARGDPDAEGLGGWSSPEENRPLAGNTEPIAMRMPLSPLQYFRRSADIYRGRPGVIDGTRRLTYGEFASRCLGLAAGLRALRWKPGDRAAVFAPNTHRALECYYAVPLAAGVLVPLNIRLTLDDYRYILTHSGCRLLLADPEFMPAALALAQAVPVQVV